MNISFINFSFHENEGNKHIKVKRITALLISINTYFLFALLLSFSIFIWSTNCQQRSQSERNISKSKSLSESETRTFLNVDKKLYGSKNNWKDWTFPLILLLCLFDLNFLFTYVLFTTFAYIFRTSSHVVLFTTRIYPFKWRRNNVDNSLD